MNAEQTKETILNARKDGAAWAKDTATKGQIARLRRFVAQQEDFEEWCNEQEDEGVAASTMLALVIDPTMEPGGYCCPVKQFWEEVGGPDADTDDPDYLNGFIDGALVGK